MIWATLVWLVFAQPVSEARLEVAAVVAGKIYRIRPSEIMGTMKIETHMGTGRYMTEPAGSADCGIMQTRNKYSSVPCGIRAAVVEIGVLAGAHEASEWKRICGAAMWDAYKRGRPRCWTHPDKQGPNACQGDECTERSRRVKRLARRWKHLD